MRCYGHHSCLDFRGDHGYFILEDYPYTLKNCEHSGPNGLSAAYTFVTLLQLRFSGWPNSYGLGLVEKVPVSLPTKFLSNLTSGSVLIGDYILGPAHVLGLGISYQSNV